MSVHIVLKLICLALALQVLSRVATPFKAFGLMLVVLALFGSRSSAVEAFANTANPDAVTYGSKIELQHVATAGRDPNASYLISESAAGWHPGSSGQPQVSLAAGKCSQSMWVVKGKVDQGRYFNEGQAINSGDVVRFEDAWAGRNLHSLPAPADGPAGLNEVTGFGSQEGDDTNSHWKVIVDGGGPWLKGSTVSLQHVATGLYLSSPNSKRRVFSDANNQLSTQVVGAASAANADTVWKAANVERPDNPAVRFFGDAGFDRKSMDDYQTINDRTEIKVNKVRDGRVGNELLQSLIVPAGYVVELFREDNQRNSFAKYYEGKYDSLNLGTFRSYSIRRYCGITSG